MKAKAIFIFLASILLCGCDSQPAVHALKPDAVIVAFGDSLTQGIGTEPADSYPAVLANMSHRTVINAGISGELSAEGLQRLPSVIEQYSPQLIIICHGANDILRRQSMLDAENNIRAMIKLAKDKNIDVVLVAVPGFNLWASSPTFYKTLAGDFNIPFGSGIIGDLEKNNHMKSDAVHFNKEGYNEVAKAIYTVLVDAKAL